MLVTQMVWAHSRVAYLTKIANGQQQLKQVAVISEAVEKAHNTNRRLALALADYRRPAKSFTAIGQQNAAAQQVVQQNTGGPPQNEKPQNGNPAKEKGMLPEPSDLPPLASWPSSPAGEHRAREAVAVHAGTGDGGGQAEQPQLMEARRPIGSGKAPAA